MSMNEYIDQETQEWYRLTPQERFAESQKLWDTFLLLGGSLDPEPDSQSPFHPLRFSGKDAADGRAGVHPLRSRRV